MQRRHLLKTLLTAAALAAAVLALYFQLFERRSRQEEARLAAARLESALATARTRLKAEILAELRAGIEQGATRLEGPVPDTVLRRREPGRGGPGSLGQAADPLRGGAPTLAELLQSLEALDGQMEESDRALRRDLEELRTATRGEAEVDRKVTSLALVALIALASSLLVSIRRPRVREPDEG